MQGRIVSIDLRALLFRVSGWNAGIQWVPIFPLNLYFCDAILFSVAISLVFSFMGEENVVRVIQLT